MYINNRPLSITFIAAVNAKVGMSFFLQSRNVLFLQGCSGEGRRLCLGLGMAGWGVRMEGGRAKRALPQQSAPTPAGAAGFGSHTPASALILHTVCAR